MLHHVPILAGGVDTWVFACCCGWVPCPGDNSLKVHLRRAAVIAKGTRLKYDGLVGHFNGPQSPVHMLDRPEDHEDVIMALRMGDWSGVAEKLKEAEADGATDREGSNEANRHR